MRHSVLIAFVASELLCLVLRTTTTLTVVCTKPCALARPHIYTHDLVGKLIPDPPPPPWPFGCAPGAPTIPCAGQNPGQILSAAVSCLLQEGAAVILLPTPRQDAPQAGEPPAPGAALPVEEEQEEARTKPKMGESRDSTPSGIVTPSKGGPGKRVRQEAEHSAPGRGEGVEEKKGATRRCCGSEGKAETAVEDAAWGACGEPHGKARAHGRCARRRGLRGKGLSCVATTDAFPFLLSFMRFFSAFPCLCMSLLCQPPACLPLV